LVSAPLGGYTKPYSSRKNRTHTGVRSKTYDVRPHSYTLETSAGLCISSLMVGGSNVLAGSTFPPGKLVVIQYHVDSFDLGMLVRLVGTATGLVRLPPAPTHYLDTQGHVDIASRHYVQAARSHRARQFVPQCGEFLRCEGRHPRTACRAVLSREGCQSKGCA
jgi:hypothetical protein